MIHPIPSSLLHAGCVCVCVCKSGEIFNARTIRRRKIGFSLVRGVKNSTTMSSCFLSPAVLEVGNVFLVFGWAYLTSSVGSVLFSVCHHSSKHGGVGNAVVAVGRDRSWTIGDKTREEGFLAEALRPRTGPVIIKMRAWYCPPNSTVVARCSPHLVCHVPRNSVFWRSYGL